MKKTLIALAALAATASFAQSTATISGSMQVGIMDTGAAGATADVSHLGNGMNAINIVTSEDLGGGLKGGFDSQIRFNAVSGDRNSSGVGNALFHGANVYLSGGFGTVRMGKIIEASNCAFDPWACGGGAAMAAGTGISNLAGAGTQAGSVSYATPTIAGFSASLQTTQTTRTNERQVMSLNYANGPISAQYLQVKNSANTAADPALSMTTATPYTVAALSAAPITDVKAKVTSIAGSYDFGVAKVNLLNVVTKDASDVTTKDITSITGSVPMGAYTILAGYSKDKKQAATADTKTALGVNYALSKRTTLGADVFKAEAAGASTGFVIRARHTF
jgi:hypothetical protein